VFKIVSFAALSLILTAPVAARTHHHETSATHHGTHHGAKGKTSSHATKHGTAKHGTAKAAKHGKKAEKKAEANPAPKGVTSVPAGGLKVYCAAARKPLLVRQFTQGSGTTVTVLCK
jgi:hypothetical protein